MFVDEHLVRPRPATDDLRPRAGVLAPNFDDDLIALAARKPGQPSSPRSEAETPRLAGRPKLRVVRVSDAA